MQQIDSGRIFFEEYKRRNNYTKDIETFMNEEIFPIAYKNVRDIYSASNNVFDQLYINVKKFGDLSQEANKKKVALAVEDAKSKLSEKIKDGIKDSTTIIGGRAVVIDTLSYNDTSMLYSASSRINDFTIHNIDKWVDDNRTKDRHSSYYIPPYFEVFGSDKPLKPLVFKTSKRKFDKNVRPKNTCGNRKFYR